MKTFISSKTRFLPALTVACAAFLSSALAQDSTTHRSLSMEGARKAAEAAVKYARQNGATPSIAIVDDSGHLLYFVRIDGGFAASANVAIGKARTAAAFRKSTKEFEDIINKGRFTMTALPDFTPLQGGVLIKDGDQVLGAIGVSGAKSAAQDEDVALAGVAAVGPVKTTAAK